jgi:CheY-like chemotaxis protein
MDHMMPEMDGIEAVRIIRNEIGTAYARQAPIVALTANAVEGNREMFLRSGFNDFISKPIDIKRLDIVLNQWVRNTQSEETLREAGGRTREQAEARKEDAPGNGGMETGDAGRWLLDHPVEGVDFNAALRLYGGDGAALMTILQSFLAHTPALIQKMDAHLETSLPDYAVEVHGLKGTCAAICASESAELARELEFASREGRGDFVKARHGELRRQVLALTEGLKVLAAGWEARRPVVEKEGRKEPDRELLVRLSAAAGDFNSNEVEAVLGELEQRRYEEGEELIRWLREQAENFDYHALHNRLEEFLNNG